jgi:hypothetical protein
MIDVIFNCRSEIWAHSQMLKLSQILPPPKKIKPLPSTRGKDTPKTRQKTRETQTRQRSRGTQPPTRQTVPGTAVRLFSILYIYQ